VDGTAEQTHNVVDWEIGKATCNRSGTRHADADDRVPFAVSAAFDLQRTPKRWYSVRVGDPSEFRSEVVEATRSNAHTVRSFTSVSAHGESLARLCRYRHDRRDLRPTRRAVIVEYIRYRIEPSRTDEFDDAYRRAGALLDASPHCRRWEAARCVYEPDKQIVRIEWDSAEGHVQGFRQSAEFKPFLEATQPFYRDIEEMTHYKVTTNG
jgi:heme-degrading monooxygenase HmoA